MKPVYAFLLVFFITYTTIMSTINTFRIGNSPDVIRLQNQIHILQQQHDDFCNFLSPTSMTSPDQFHAIGC